MKRTSIIAALVLSAVSSAIAQQQSAQTRDAASTEQAVQQQDQVRIRAQITADTIALRRIYADDFLGIGPTGVVRNKAEVIADFTTHALTYQSITTAEVRVRVYGNTAVETGRSTMVGQDRGKDVPRENRFTRVWVMTDGRWQLVANHLFADDHAIGIMRFWQRLRYIEREREGEAALLLGLTTRCSGRTRVSRRLLGRRKRRATRRAAERER